MTTEEKSVSRSIRADKEVFSRFTEIAKDKGMNQGALLEALINAWDIQNAKGLVPERAADVADFDAALQALQKAFLRSLDLASSAESRARIGYQVQLDALSGTVARLEKELLQATEAANKATQRANAAEERAERAEKRVLELEKAQADGNRTEAILTAVQAFLQEQTNKAPQKPKPPAKSKKIASVETPNGQRAVDLQTGIITETPTPAQTPDSAKTAAT